MECFCDLFFTWNDIVILYKCDFFLWFKLVSKKGREFFPKSFIILNKFHIKTSKIRLLMIFDQNWLKLVVALCDLPLSSSCHLTYQLSPTFCIYTFTYTYTYTDAHTRADTSNITTCHDKKCQYLYIKQQDSDISSELHFNSGLEINMLSIMKVKGKYLWIKKVNLVEMQQVFSLVLF